MWSQEGFVKLGKVKGWKCKEAYRILGYPLKVVLTFINHESYECCCAAEDAQKTMAILNNKGGRK